MEIILSENQFNMFKTLFESEMPLLNNGNVKEKGDLGQVGTSATITDADGDPKNGKDVYADEISKFQANQDWRGGIRLRTGAY